MKAAPSCSISLVAILIAAGTSAQVLVNLAGPKCMAIQFDNGAIRQRAPVCPPPPPRHHR